MTRVEEAEETTLDPFVLVTVPKDGDDDDDSGDVITVLR